MKKLISLTMAVLMLMTIAIAALAESTASSPIAQTIDSCGTLLFGTDNVTLKGGVELSLDGNWFKTAEVTCQQEGYNSCIDLKVKSLRKNGKTKDSGYTVFDQNGAVHLVEVINPGVYQTTAAVKNNTVLRGSAKTELLLSLLRALGNQAEAFVGDKAVTVTKAENGGQEIQLKLDSAKPEILDQALTLLLQFTGERFFNVNSDDIFDHTGNFSDYITVSRAILYTTKAVSVQNAEITVKLDEKGELKSIAGSGAVKLTSVKGEEHLLEGKFNMDVSERGTTKAEVFDAEKHAGKTAK